jgi:signal transduction histidine kinase
MTPVPLSLASRPPLVWGTDVPRHLLFAAVGLCVSALALGQWLGAAGALLPVAVWALATTALWRRAVDADTRLRGTVADLAVTNAALDARASANNQALSERSARMRLILDHVTQGLAVVDRDGRIEDDHSAAFLRQAGGTRTSDLIAWASAVDVHAAEWLRVGWRDLFDGVMPFDIVAAQLPCQLCSEDATLDIEYHAIRGDDGEVRRVLIVVSNGTDRVLRGRSEREGRDLLGLMEVSASDPAFLRQSVDELDEHIAVIADDSAPYDVRRRALHTMKGTLRMLGAYAIAEQAAVIEGVAHEAGDRSFPAAELMALTEAWQHLRERVGPIVGHGDDVTLTPDDIYALVDELANKPGAAFAGRLRGLLDDPADQVLSRYAQEALRLSLRMKKPANIVVTAADVRFPRALRPVWAELVHLVRNAVDHGVDDVDTRRAQGKPERATIELRAHEDDRGIVVEVVDDGRGIDWDALAKRAQKAGVALNSPRDALFVDGVSTKDDVTDVSGLGVGLASVRAAVERRGGVVDVDSDERGTRVTLRLPLPGARVVEVPAPAVALAS